MFVVRDPSCLRSVSLVIGTLGFFANTPEILKIVFAFLPRHFRDYWSAVLWEHTATKFAVSMIGLPNASRACWIAAVDTILVDAIKARYEHAKSTARSIADGKGA